MTGPKTTASWKGFTANPPRHRVPRTAFDQSRFLSLSRDLHVKAVARRSGPRSVSRETVNPQRSLRPLVRSEPFPQERAGDLSFSSPDANRLPHSRAQLPPSAVALTEAEATAPTGFHGKQGEPQTGVWSTHVTV